MGNGNTRYRRNSEWTVVFDQNIPALACVSFLFTISIEIFSLLYNLFLVYCDRSLFVQWKLIHSLIEVHGDISKVTSNAMVRGVRRIEFMAAYFQLEKRGTCYVNINDARGAGEKPTRRLHFCGLQARRL